MKEKWPTIAIAVAAFLVLVVYLVVFQVRINEVAVHYRLGSVMRQVNAGREEEQAGWYFKLPWPLDNVYKYDKRVQVLDGRLVQTELQDNRSVLVSSYAGWRISNPLQFEKTQDGDIKTAQANLLDIVETATSEAVANATMEDLVSTKTEQKKLNAIEDNILQNVRNEVQQNEYGIEVVSCGIRRMAVPEETTQAIFSKMRRERLAQAKEYRSEGQRLKTTLIEKAKSEREKTVADAMAEAKKIRAEGEAAEAQYYDVFAKAPDLHNFLRRLEALSNIAEKAGENGQSITFVLSTSTEPFGVLERGPSGSQEQDKEEKKDKAEETQSSEKAEMGEESAE